MGLLIEFFGVLLHSVALLALALAVGGVVVTLFVLRPWQPLTIMGRMALRRSAYLIALGGGVLAVTQFLQLSFQFLDLADGSRDWPVAQFLAADFAQAGVVQIVAAMGLTSVSLFWLSRRPASLTGWIVLAFISGLIVIAGAWLVHAASRIDNRILLMIMTVCHQLAAVIWVGGILLFLALWRLIWGNLEASYLWPRWVARFSSLALFSVIFLIAVGVYLAVTYVGSWQGLIGTGYGIMILTKVALLILALTLAARNFFHVRCWQQQHQTAGVLEKLPTFLGAEAWILSVALLSAAVLTSMPPAVDTLDQQVSFTELVENFMPKMPRLVPPSREEYSTVASSVFDVYALPVAVEKTQSEFNHNFSGAVVLVMALLALVDRRQSFAWARHWPLLFLGLAVFLSLFAASTVWPLGSESFWKTLLVPEVLEHRLFTVLVVALGLFEWRVRTGKLTHPRALLAFPLLCIVGGALLLAHSHERLALKSEFLIEANHVVLGILAVIMGVGRWLELRLDTIESDWAGWVWRVSFILFGLFLLFYSESLST